MIRSGTHNRLGVCFLDSEPVSDRCSLDAVRRAELAKDVGDVHPSRLGADEERCPDLSVRAARNHQPEDLALAPG